MVVSDRFLLFPALSNFAAPNCFSFHCCGIVQHLRLCSAKIQIEVYIRPRNIEFQLTKPAEFSYNVQFQTCWHFHFSQLLRDPQVLFAGYKNPHPLEHKIVLRVQTTDDYTPAEALKAALEDLISELHLFDEQFQEGLAERRDDMA